MSTLLLLLALMMPTEDTEQLQTYITVGDTVNYDRNNPDNTTRETQIGVSCEVYPKTLTVGDILYAKATAKNITTKPVNYTPVNNTLGNERFIFTVYIQKDTSAGSSQGNFDSMEAYDRPPLHVTPRPGSGTAERVLLPGEILTSGPQSFLLPFPGDYEKPVWTWDEIEKKEKILLTFPTRMSSRMPDGVIRRIPIAINQEVVVKQRPKDELALIKEFSDKTQKFDYPWGDTSPSPAQWLEFEEKLTPGTLRNHIRMRRTLLEIAQDENKGKRQEMFDEMLKWIDQLPELEKEGLRKQAYATVKNRKPYRTFDNEIALPEP